MASVKHDHFIFESHSMKYSTVTFVGWFLVVLAAVIGAVQFFSWNTSRLALNTDHRQYLHTARDVSEFVELNHAMPDVGTKSDSDMAARVASVSIGCGLGPSAILAVLPESAAFVVNDTSRRLVRHAARVSFHSITLMQLGRFADSWRQVEPTWTISAIEFSPENTDTTPFSGSPRIRATLVIEAVFAESDATENN